MQFSSFDKPQEALITVTSARADEGYVVFNVKDYEIHSLMGVKKMPRNPFLSVKKRRIIVARKTGERMMSAIKAPMKAIGRLTREI